jgi:hypothetical protein
LVNIEVRSKPAIPLRFRGPSPLIDLEWIAGITGERQPFLSKAV